MNLLDISKVEITDEYEHMYDLHVEDNHNFILKNDIITHNSGKTAFSFWLACELHKYNIPIYYFGNALPGLPIWITSTLSWEDIEDKSLIIVDEGILSIGARNALTKENKAANELMAISRHHDYKIIINSQYLAGADISTWRQSDAFYCKPLPMIDTADHESNRAKAFMKYMILMQPRNYTHCLFTNGDNWFLFEHELPYFWSDIISKSFKKINWKEAVELIVNSYDKGASARQIQTTLRARGHRLELRELREIYTHPQQAKKSAESYMQYSHRKLESCK